MVKIAICLLLATALAPSWSQPPGELVRTGLSDETPSVATPQPAPTSQSGSQPESTCPADVVITRDIKYDDDDANIIEIATKQTRPGDKRPILIFITDDGIGERQAVAPADPFAVQAICVAAERGLVAFHVRYRKSGTGVQSKGIRDIAAAISWIVENADLFGGNVTEIVPIGFRTGASYLAGFLSNKTYHVIDDKVAGAVLISGSYQGEPKSEDGSVTRGLIDGGWPIVLAWSSADQPQLIDEGQNLSSRLCAAGHCPRTAVIGAPANSASVFNLDGASSNLHDRVRQLISQLDARGLP